MFCRMCGFMILRGRLAAPALTTRMHRYPSSIDETPNKPDAVNPAIASRFQVGYHRRGVTDPGRWRHQTYTVNMSDEPLLHIIYLESRMLLSKKRYSDWRQIQDEFADYKTSLGPWSTDGVMEFFSHDWGADGTRWPFT